jgi:lanthanide-dependent methanol dehydrogenase
MLDRVPRFGGVILAATMLVTLALGQPVPSEDGQWTMPAKNFENTRYSGLTQIKIDNAKKLRVAWTFSTGVNKGQEAPPLVVGDTMYIVTPYPNVLFALDLKNSGAVKWKFEPEPSAAAQGVACCDVVNRGCFLDKGKVFFNTLDNNVCAVDANSGKLLWKTKVGEINHGETITMAPLVVHDKVLVGNSGGEFGVRGWLTALDANNGKIAWRAYSTGPDADCLIGSDFKPFYATDRGKDLGVKSWPPDHWQIGGGTVWGWISYDAEQNLIFYGTANPGTWNPELRPGDNKWTCGIFARNPDTGQAHWFYQLNPHDEFDHDGVNENIVVDLPASVAAGADGGRSTQESASAEPESAPPVRGGNSRKCLLSAQRNGYVYVLDRTTGQVLSATPFVRITASKGVDLKSGRIIPNDEKKPQIGKVIRDVAPASPGGKDWQPCAWSPRTHLLYIPHQNLAMDYEGVEASYIEGTPYLGVNVKMYANGGGKRGEFCAWDPVQKKKVWSIEEDFPVWSGTLVTASDVTFYGTMDGWFKAVNAKTGEVLWQFKTGSGIIGQPTTFLGPDGKQYVAVLSGVGGWAGAVVSGDLDVRDPTAALGFANAMKDLPQHTAKGGTLYVFALP